MRHFPYPGTKKERVLKAAMHLFSQQPYEAIPIHDLAQQAGVTIGTIYHHFQSKLGLYEVICNEIERRVLDRMEGAIELVPERNNGIYLALISGITFSYKYGFTLIFAEKNHYLSEDGISLFLKEATRTSLPTHLLLFSAWQTLNKELANETITLNEAISLLKWQSGRLDLLHPSPHLP
ncbi:TetR/AcrR family transcriptional regulator [Shouchella sp. JSM 1781072]|uniref:TetR/AcrR family transcriptional regulator n=1 Tax=Shouchella sp. JSM 1781072 TaxID=3344581 RepID=UPI0035C23556